MEENQVIHSLVVIFIIFVVGLLIVYGDQIVSLPIIGSIAIGISMYFSFRQVWKKKPVINFQNFFFRRDLGSTPATQHHVFFAIVNDGDISTNINIKQIYAVKNGNVISTAVINLNAQGWLVLDPGQTKIISFIMNLSPESDYSLKIDYRYTDKVKIIEKNAEIKKSSEGTLYLTQNVKI